MLGGCHLLKHGPYLVQRADGRRQRVQHQSMYGRLPILFQHCRSHQLMECHMLGVECRQLWREIAEAGGLYAVSIH